MRKILTIAAAGFMFAATLPAHASSDDVSCGSPATGQKLSIEAITAKVTEMGYDVRKVESDDNCYEVYAIDKNGERFELYINSVSGALVKSKRKS